MTRRLLALITTLAVVATGCSVFGGGTMDVQAEFRRTFNLFPQSPVTVLGVDVGEVVDIETSPGSEVVTVTMRIDEDVEVSRDSSAVVLTSSLLGERYVQLVNGEEDEPLGPDTVIPIERTHVPFEFDEVLEGLNDFVGGLESEEVARLVTNLSDLLEGNGAQLGETIDAASGAVAALKDNDEELIELAGAVADLNETIATRDQELAALLEDWIRVTDTLTSESTDLDGALDNLVVLTRQIAEIMLEHRETLSQDIDTVTRVGRTLNRHLDEQSTAILGAAELFRHAERVVDRESNMLPLVNHSEEGLGTDLEDALIGSLTRRLEALCVESGGSEEECSQLGGMLEELEEGEGGELCLDPLIPCEETSVPLSTAIAAAVEEHPSIGDQLLERRQERREGDQDAPRNAQEGAIDDALRQVGLLGQEDYR